MTTLFFVGCGSPLQVAVDSGGDGEGTQNADGAVALTDGSELPRGEPVDGSAGEVDSPADALVPVDAVPLAADTAPAECMPGMNRCRDTTSESCDGAGRWAPGSGDCVPPTILSAVPKGVSAGVRSDATIEITFSEPMDRNSTQAAFAPSGFGSPVFAWSAGDRTLSVKPADGFPYAAGGLDVTAKQYGYSLATTATDVAGHRLAAGVSATFTTLRRITVRQTPDYTMTGSVDMTGHNWGYNIAIWVGCSNRVPRGFLTFDIGALPPGIVEIESAALDMVQKASGSGTPPFRPIEVSQVRFSVLASVSTYNTPALRDVGAITTSFEAGARHLSNTQLRDALKDDYLSRQLHANRSQFRINDGNCATRMNDYYFLTGGADDPALSVTFTVN